MSKPPPSPKALARLPYRRCVGVLLFNRRGEVFVGRRIDTEGDAWQLPQGGIDDGETPAAAALRELREEVGTDRAEIIGESRGWFSYDLPAELVPKMWGGRYRGQTQKWFALRFLGNDGDICLTTHHPEFSAWKWVDVQRLPDMIVPFKRQLYRDLVAEFGGLAASLAVTPDSPPGDDRAT